jgi:hypothetical protein
MTQPLHGAGVPEGFTVGVLVGVFVGVAVGILVIVFVAWEESDDLDHGSPGIEKHPADSRQTTSSRAMSMNRVDFCRGVVFSPDLKGCRNCLHPCTGLESPD